MGGGSRSRLRAHKSFSAASFTKRVRSASHRNKVNSEGKEEGDTAIQLSREKEGSVSQAAIFRPCYFPAGASTPAYPSLGKMERLCVRSQNTANKEGIGREKGRWRKLDSAVLVGGSYEKIMPYEKTPKGQRTRTNSRRQFKMLNSLL